MRRGNIDHRLEEAMHTLGRLKHELGVTPQNQLMFERKREQERLERQERQEQRERRQREQKRRDFYSQRQRQVRAIRTQLEKNEDNSKRESQELTQALHELSQGFHDIRHHLQPKVLPPGVDPERVKYMLQHGAMSKRTGLPMTEQEVINFYVRNHRLSQQKAKDQAREAEYYAQRAPAHQPTHQPAPHQPTHRPAAHQPTHQPAPLQQIHIHRANQEIARRQQAKDAGRPQTTRKPKYTHELRGLNRKWSGSHIPESTTRSGMRWKK